MVCEVIRYSTLPSYTTSPLQMKLRATFSPVRHGTNQISTEGFFRLVFDEVPHLVRDNFTVEQVKNPLWSARTSAEGSCGMTAEVLVLWLHCQRLRKVLIEAPAGNERLCILHVELGTVANVSTLRFSVEREA
jgi:hypothetical protein